MNSELLDRFQEWADDALAHPVPSSVVAFNFNLYEMSSGVDMDLVGSDWYSEEDREWALGEVFVARDPVFEIPEQFAGPDWRASLDLAISLVKRYLANRTKGNELLVNSQAVTVGFVDGDLERVWPAV